jgi:hypothetical protein
MPFGGIVLGRPGGAPLRVPGGTDRPPWLQPYTGPVEHARTWVVVEQGPQLLHAADAEPPPAPPASGRSLGSSPQVPVRRRRR